MKRFFITTLLVLTMVFIMCMTSFASESSLVPPNLSGTNDSYIIIHTGNSNGRKEYIAIVYNSEDWTLTYDKDSYTWPHIVWTKNRDTAYVRYCAILYDSEYDPSADNNGWGTLNQYNNMQTQTLNIVASNRNIYGTSNDLVFQVPPQLGATVRESLVNFQTKTGGVMKTLTLCGVGCLALLIGLRLFGKRSLIFRR